MKKVVLDAFATCPDDPQFTMFEGLGKDARIYARTSAAQAIERIGDAEIVLTNKVVISREVMEACPKMRYVGVLATGYNIVDMQAAAERGIVVTNVPAYSTSAVVQHVVALMLSRASRIAEYAGHVREGQWVRSTDFCFFAEPTEELAGRVFGIIGYGSIGQAMARAAAGLGMRVMIATPHPEGKPLPEGAAFVTMDTLLEESDYISLHCPLTETTRGIINAKTIAKMKKTVTIINTARGPVVDGAAVAAALHEGRIGCYMADVMEQEPPKADDPLLSAPNVVLTPHIAWVPRQTRERLVGIAVGNVNAFLAGAPVNVVR